LSSISTIGWTRTGYSFAGWTENQNGTGTSYTDAQSVTLTSGLTLYAKWTIISYTITFNGNGNNGGTGSSAVTNDYGTVISMPSFGETSQFSRTGYFLGGWNTASDGTGAMYVQGATSVYTIVGNATLYAIWLKAPSVSTATASIRTKASPQTITYTGPTTIKRYSTDSTTITVNLNQQPGETYRYKWWIHPGGTVLKDYSTDNSFTVPNTYFGSWVEVDVEVKRTGQNSTSATGTWSSVAKFLLEPLTIGTFSNIGTTTFNVNQSSSSAAFEYSGTEDGTKTYSEVGTLTSAVSFYAATYKFTGTTDRTSVV
jgi:uncharacterized repeat protein (TIGR02543 family)